MSRHGYVYVLSNPGMPGIYKVGKTKRSPKQRAAELSTTGVLAPFKVEYSKLMDDCHAAEKLAHRHFARQRVNKNREFFQADLGTIIRMVESIPSDLAEQARKRAEAERIIKEKKRAEKEKEYELVWKLMLYLGGPLGIAMSAYAWMDPAAGTFEAIIITPMSFFVTMIYPGLMAWETLAWVIRNTVMRSRQWIDCDDQKIN